MKNFGRDMSRIIRDRDRFRSMFESLISQTLGSKATYETDTFNFIEPAKNRKYTPDFKLGPKAYIEAKGLFDSSDRVKMKLVKAQYPDITFYLLFQNANKRLNKTSKTTYAMWAEKNGFKWGHFPKGIPKEWLEGV